jgi:hypothetical protein
MVGIPMPQNMLGSRNFVGSKSPSFETGKKIQKVHPIEGVSTPPFRTPKNP